MMTLAELCNAHLIFVIMGAVLEIIKVYKMVRKQPLYATNGIQDYADVVTIRGGGKDKF